MRASLEVLCVEVSFSTHPGTGILWHMEIPFLLLRYIPELQQWGFHDRCWWFRNAVQGAIHPSLVLSALWLQGLGAFIVVL